MNVQLPFGHMLCEIIFPIKIQFSFLLICFAVVTIYLGLDLNQVGLGKPGLYAVIIFFIGVFLILVFEFYLIMSKCNKAKKIDTRGRT